MYFIGLDFSITGPAFCVTKDFKTWKFIGALNKNETKKFKKFIEDCNSLPDIEILFIDYEVRKKSPQYHITERNKLMNYSELIQGMLAALKKEVGDSPCIIAMEGQSFASKGNALVDISQATGIIRYCLAQYFLENKMDNFFVFSPAKLKNTIGCKGNAKKDEILTAFLENPGIDSVKTSSLYKLLKEDDGMIIASQKNIKSPFMDMIDAYLAVLKLYNEISNNQSDNVITTD